MAITGQMIADVVRTLLIDPSGTRWADPEYLAAINEGQRQVINLRPEAGAVEGMIPVVSGTAQTLPAEGLRLVSVISSASGRTVTEIQRDVMDSYRPEWRQETGDEPIHYLYDDREPGIFYLYPGPASSGQVRARYVAAPDDLASLASPISLHDLYEPALRFFVMYHLLSKDTGAADFQKAGGYYGLFAQLLSGKVEATTMLNPEQMSRRMNG